MRGRPAPAALPARAAALKGAVADEGAALGSGQTTGEGDSTGRDCAASLWPAKSATDVLALSHACACAACSVTDGACTCASGMGAAGAAGVAAGPVGAMSAPSTSTSSVTGSMVISPMRASTASRYLPMRLRAAHFCLVVRRMTAPSNDEGLARSSQARRSSCPLARTSSSMSAQRNWASCSNIS